MSFSNRDKVRLRVGDTDESDPLLYDDEIDSLLEDRSIVTTGGTAYDITAAAADAAQAIAGKFARGFNFSTDGQSFNRSERVAHYTELAEYLRRQSGGASVTVMSPTSAAQGDGLTLGA